MHRRHVGLLAFLTIPIAFGSLGALHGQASAPPKGWTETAPPGAGFRIQGPGTTTSDPARPGHYAFGIGKAAFLLDVDAINDVMREAVTAHDRPIVTKYLEAMRDGSIGAIKATRRGTSSVVDVDGWTSIRFRFDGEADSKAFEAHELIALTDEHVFILVAIGEKGDLKTDDADRFLSSFHLVTAPAPSASSTASRTVTFTDAVCGRIPPVPITFEMPANYLSRKVGTSSEAGCLWGAKDDLDRVTADPEQGDFTSLRAGVFRARMSTNIVYSDNTGAFDQMDGTGEAGIRRGLQSAGARVAIWKKQTLSGLPALEIVADLGGSRVFMLYLGNTRYISNTLLVNYYPPSRRSADDDRVWARFVAGIRSTGG